MKKSLLIILWMCLPALMWAQTLIERPSYTLKYPQEWSQQKSQSADVLLLGPSKTAEFTNNLNVLIQDNNDNLDMKAYVQLSEKQIKTMMKGVKITESKTIAPNVHHIVYSGEIMNKHLSFMQRYIYSGKNFYVLTFTATPSEFEGLKKSALEIIDSFHLK